MKKRPDNSQLQNYLSIISIVPAVISIMAYEFLDYMLYIIHPERTDYDPITGLGILIPMSLMMELFTYFFSRRLLKKTKRITTAINQIGNGDYSVSIDEKHMAPFSEVVSNLNHMSEKLQSVETLRADFINDFSHEFKTPISSINGFANLLLDSNVTDEERNEYLHIIANESARLAHLSEQTIMMSRLDTQTDIPNKKIFSLDEQIKQVIILLSKDWTAKKINMDVDLDPIMYYGNDSMMIHIWINLINNAIKFTPNQGTISITLKSDSSNNLPIIFKITDSGKGMNEEQIKHIFDKYYQAEKSHSSHGLGLGLSIVSRTVQLCGGIIQVQSKPNMGSTFNIRLGMYERN